jgi:CelD/BcsL family acetyltransferase involved in cellulose biosynthesis
VIYSLDPLGDARWGRFLARHPQATIFHSAPWLEAIQRTYGYVPVVLTSSKPTEELENGTAFSIVRSWLVRPRLVSIPFSDHVDPLLESEDGLRALFEEFQRGRSEGRWKSVELRPPATQGRLHNWSPFHEGKSYALHRINLEASLASIFSRFHHDSIQRKIRKAERVGLVYAEGRNESLLNEFFRLHVETRKRHGLPPPPKCWFRNLLDCLKEQAKIRIASKNGVTIAAVLTLRYKDMAIYKYGCTKEEYHNLGGMPFLLWRAIQDAKETGAKEFDLGRSDPGDLGLIAFKEKFGAERSGLTYRVYPAEDGPGFYGGHWMKLAMRVFTRLPKSALVVAGKLIYPHIG